MQLGPSLDADSAGDAARIFVLTGPSGLGSEKAARLLERAVAESGLGRAKLQVLAGTAAVRLARARAMSGGLVVALGAETAAILLSRMVSMPLERGKVRALPQGGRVLVTEHPATILGLSDLIARGREYRRLVAELQLAVPMRRLAA
ncbi:MAG: hypothetical protein ACJ8H8_34505 [Geminicoccaceae bacterium]